MTQKLLPVLADGATMFGALWVSLWWRQPDLLDATTFLLFAPLFATWLVAIYIVGLNDLRRVRDFVELVGSLLISAGACWVLGTMYFYLTTPYMPLAPKTHLVLVILLTHACFLAWRRGLLTILGFTLLDLRILVLADATHREYLKASTHSRFDGELNLVEKPDPNLDLVVIDRRSTAEELKEARQHIVSALSGRVPIVSLDDFYESLFGKVSSIDAGDLTWAIEHVLSRSGSVYFKAKRLVDVIVAAIAIVVLMPFMLLTALAIYLGDGMHPMFGQERVGYLRQRFTMWKFRTMRPGSDAHGPFAAEAGEMDPRVTRLGRVLRRFRLDELPQLWNVLRGEMSLVGPRPEWIREVEILEREVPTYHLRHLVAPGLTGWAQVYFRSTNNARDSREKHQYDLYYLKHFSLALDFTILLKTLKRVFMRDSRVTTTASPLSHSQDAHSSANRVDIASIIGP